MLVIMCLFVSFIALALIHRTAAIRARSLFGEDFRTGQISRSFGIVGFVSSLLCLGALVLLFLKAHPKPLEVRLYREFVIAILTGGSLVLAAAVASISELRQSIAALRAQSGIWRLYLISVVGAVCPTVVLIALAGRTLSPPFHIFFPTLISFEVSQCTLLWLFIGRARHSNPALRAGQSKLHSAP